MQKDSRSSPKEKKIGSMNFWLKSGCMKWIHTKEKKKKMEEIKRRRTGRNWKEFMKRIVWNIENPSHADSIENHVIWITHSHISITSDLKIRCFVWVESVLKNIRYKREKKNGISIEKHPPSMKRGERKLLFASIINGNGWFGIDNFSLYEWKSMWKWTNHIFKFNKMHKFSHNRQYRSKERKSIPGLCCTFFTWQERSGFRFFCWIFFIVKCRAMTTKCRNFHCVSQFNSPLMSIVLLTGTVAIAKLKHHQIPPPHQIPKRKSYNLYLLNRDTSKFILTQNSDRISHPINKNVNAVPILPVVLIFDHVERMKRTFWY